MQQYSENIFVENIDVSQKTRREYKFLKIFFKLYKVLSTCAKFQAFDILPLRNKVAGNFVPPRPNTR